ncbi:hypothetical protein AVEN_138323-1 [Araneus ventricosus]|uniref:PiggyBac transposable element-derived protein domain-containing protein n=1 Tax=Araneus ventricosus TaxID=182803 RepID=A0A4Y2J2S0_ARAVE|nr:hypothetical protein AVEN_138323-1 [Araneus ventricosus]
MENFKRIRAYPYRITLGQYLLPRDRERRFDFCNFILSKCDKVSTLAKEILWTDESQFTREESANILDSHFGALENPQNLSPNNHQVRWSVNVWCGIWKLNLIWLFSFDDALTSTKYMHILSRPLSDYLEESVSLSDLSRM